MDEQVVGPRERDVRRVDGERRPDVVGRAGDVQPRARRGRGGPHVEVVVLVPDLVEGVLVRPGAGGADRELLPGAGFVLRQERTAVEGEARGDVVRAQRVAQERTLRLGVPPGITGDVADVAVVGRQQDLGAGVALPPDDVLRHDLVAEALGVRHRRRVGEVDREELRGLGDGPGVLRHPVVAEALHQLESLLGLGREPLPLRERLGHVGEDVVDRAQTGVELVQPRQRLGVGPLDVTGHPAEELVVQRRGAEVVADEVDGAAGVVAVVVAHPFDEVDELLAVPRRAGERFLRDRARVTDAGLEELVDLEPRRPAHFEGEGGEALLLDEVAEEPFLHGEELVGAVRRLAEAGHLGVADHRAQRPQVGGVPAGFGGAQRMRRLL